MKTIHLEANKIANLASLIIPKAAKQVISGAEECRQLSPIQLMSHCGVKIDAYKSEPLYTCAPAMPDCLEL